VPAEDLLTVRELATKWRVSKNAIYAAIRSGDLQCTHLGRGTNQTRIPESIADQYWQARLEPKRPGLRAVPSAA
jgi:excisionase family DNA binding protein